MWDSNQNDGVRKQPWDATGKLKIKLEIPEVLDEMIADYLDCNHPEFLEIIENGPVGYIHNKSGNDYLYLIIDKNGGIEIVGCAGYPLDKTKVIR